MPGVISIEVENAAGLDYRSESVTTASGALTSRTTLNGEVFEVAGDELHVGARRYGPLRPGCVVIVGADGIRIDGARAEPLR